MYCKYVIIFQIKVKYFKHQLSEIDKANVKEQEELMAAADKEMEGLRQQLDYGKKMFAQVSSDYDTAKDLAGKLQNECGALKDQLNQNEDALAEVENELFQLKQEARACDGVSNDMVESLEASLEEVT